MTEYTNEIKEIRCDDWNGKLTIIENNYFMIKGKSNAEVLRDFLSQIITDSIF